MLLIYGYKDISKLYIIISSYIEPGYKVMPQLCINALSYIG